MNKDNVVLKKLEKDEVSNIGIYMRINEKTKKWLEENNYSSTKIFKEALKELGCPYVSTN
jgi:co-chaperonin GroES (HSP10)